MKRLVFILTALLLIGIAVLTLAPRGPGPGSLLDRLGGLLDRQDTVALAHLEHARDSLAVALAAEQAARTADSTRLADSLALLEQASRVAAGRTLRHRARADSLARVLTTIRDDDDSLPVLVRLVAAKDSQIVAVTAERDAAMGQVRVLAATVAQRDTALRGLQVGLQEALRQRDGYRSLAKGRKAWVRAAVVMAGTIAVCRAVADPC